MVTWLKFKVQFITCALGVYNSVAFIPTEISEYLYMSFYCFSNQATCEIGKMFRIMVFSTLLYCKLIYS